MLRVPAAMAILALLAPLAVAQKKGSPDKPAQIPDVLPFKATEKTLANGLKVIVVPTGFPNIVSLQIPVQTGSRNEVEPGKSGFAHFFEHMMFRGTKAYPPEEYQAILTQAGARQNAYTTDDYTNYHTTFAKEDLETILEIEADRFQNLDYPRGGLQDRVARRARRVQQEQRRTRSASSIEVQRDKAFTTHTYKHTTMGFLKDIEDMPNQFAYSKAFFDRWYRPEYTTVIVAGDVEPARRLPARREVLGRLEARARYTRRRSRRSPPPTGPVYAHVPWTSADPALGHRRLPRPRLLGRPRRTTPPSTCSSTSPSARPPTLYKKLVEDEQKVDQLFADSAGQRRPRRCSTVVRARQEGRGRGLRARRDPDGLRRGRGATPVAARRLADAKSQRPLRRSSARLDNTEAIAATLARFVRYRRSYDTLEPALPRLRLAHARRTCRRRRRSTSPTPNLVVDDALAASRCPTAMADAPARSRRFAPARRRPAAPRR